MYLIVNITACTDNYLQFTVNINITCISPSGPTFLLVVNERCVCVCVCVYIYPFIYAYSFSFVCHCPIFSPFCALWS